MNSAEIYYKKITMNLTPSDIAEIQKAIQAGKYAGLKQIAEHHKHMAAVQLSPPQHGPEYRIGFMSETDVAEIHRALGI